MWTCKFMHCADFHLLCMTTFARAIGNPYMHKLTLPHENLKLKSVWMGGFFPSLHLSWMLKWTPVQQLLFHFITVLYYVRKTESILCLRAWNLVHLIMNLTRYWQAVKIAFKLNGKYDKLSSGVDLYLQNLCFQVFWSAGNYFIHLKVCDLDFLISIL